jgi:serine/threonine protein kinase
MSDETLLDGWLDRWEELCATGEARSVEEFISQHCAGAPADLVTAFRARALALVSMDARLREAEGRTPGGEANTAPPGASAVGLEAWAEPVPGYRLVLRVGAGGFGEVWEAAGAGGFRVALKFVPLGGKSGDAELAALEQVKDLRHPHLLTLFAAWEVGGRLVIASELADRSLAHRLRQCLDAGQPGVPAGELLGYLRDAAEGLDFLHGRGVQHRDVKPSNLLLVGGALKVGDLGLAKPVAGAEGSHTGIMTAAYAPPEFFKGRATPHSDQYSLAVSYCELRGGRLPFAGTLHELMRGHLEGTPDLTMLPEVERPAVARALDKRPEGRWPNCISFAEQLAAVARAGDASTDRAEQLAQALRPLRPTGSVSVRVTIVNRTGSVLVLASFDSSSGVYLATPPASIAAGGVALFCLESCRFLSGADGWSIYQIEGKAGTFEFGYHLPYAFPNRYDYRCPEGYRVQRSGGSGRAAEVAFVVTEGASSLDPPPSRSATWGY